MPPAVTFTDVDEAANVNGSIFDDINFFITQRTPARSHYVSLVEKNGGRVVKLESQADYLIADHAKHGAPPGSFSFKLIEDAVKNGEFPDDTAPFLVTSLSALARQATNTRHVAVASTAKSTRTPFTADDDRQLYAWVKHAEEKGLPIKGNELYRQLEEVNNRHTLQSWRDRYVKTLSVKPPTGWETYVPIHLPTLQDSRLASTARSRPSSTAQPRPSSTAQPHPSSTARPLRATPLATPATVSPTKSRVSFTEEDDAELREWVSAKEKEGLRIGGNKMYEQLAAKNSRHTAHSWRSRYIDVLQYLDQARLSYLQSGASPQPAHTDTRPAPAGQLSPLRNNTTVVPSSSKLPSASRELPPKRPSITFRHQGVQANSHLGEPINDSSFTDEDYELLLANALDIQNVTVGRYQEAWIQWAEHEGSRHTAVEWRSYYERRVLPVVLQKQNDKTFWKNRNGSHSDFWENQGQPLASLPLMDDDIEAESVLKNEPVGPKKAAEGAIPAPSKQTESCQETNNSDDATQAQSSKRKLHQPESDNDEPDQAQKRRRILDQTPAEVDALALGSAQKQRQAQELINAFSQEIPNSANTSEADEADAQLQREMASESRDTRPKLTAANLRLAQVERDTPSQGHQRGVDLAEDQEDDDQDNFLGYLAKLVPKEMQENLQKSVERDGVVDDEEEVGEEEIEEEEEEEERDYEPKNNLAIQTQESQWLVDPMIDVPSEPGSEPELDPELEPEPELNPELESEHELDSELELEYEPKAQPQLENTTNNPTPTLSTQEIYAAETQPLDLDIPPPNIDTQPPDLPDSQFLAEDELWPYIDSQILKGHEEKDVFEALRKTCMNPKLATMVLDAGGKELDISGIWTAEEDEIAEGGDARKMRLLEVRHGDGAVTARLRFLSEWREEEEAAAAAAAAAAVEEEE